MTTARPALRTAALRARIRALAAQFEEQATDKRAEAMRLHSEPIHPDVFARHYARLMADADQFDGIAGQIRALLRPR